MSNTILFIHMARVLPRDQQTAVIGIGPLPRTTGALIFPFVAATVAPLWPGAALAVGAVGYAGAIAAGLHLGKLTRRLRPFRE